MGLEPATAAPARAEKRPRLHPDQCAVCIFCPGLWPTAAFRAVMPVLSAAASAGRDTDLLHTISYMLGYL
jgi:hypothetical protein